MQFQLSKIVLSWLAVAGATLWQEAESFAPSSLQVYSIGSSRQRTQLHQMFLILEDDDDDNKDVENDTMSPQANVNDNNNNEEGRGMAIDLRQLMEKLGGSGAVKDGDPQEITLILGGNTNAEEVQKMNPTTPQGGSGSMVSRWKQQLEENSSPPLTTMRRVRMEQEIALLEQMATAPSQSEEVLSNLASLWVAERGPDAENVLQATAGLLNRGHPLLWAQAETLLIEMIEREGVHFVAPLQLLASLYGRLGRIQECKDLNKMVLQQKPWHVGALVGAFQSCKALDDYPGLIRWDREQLPPLQDDPALRSQWAQRMAQKAREALHNAVVGLQNHFDGNYSTFGSDSSIVLGDEFGDNAWQ